MWIEPNGVVKILHNVDLDNKYDNTIYFATTSQQYIYFNSKVKYTYDKITYQRVKRNYMRVEINAENLYDCNYLMFQNSSFGNKWFYAFITKVEYLSNMVSEIEYEIDEMQTWFLNGNAQPNSSECTMGMCFVQREHSVFDSLYGNLIDEQLELGEYHNSVYKFPRDLNDIPYFNGMTVVFGCTFYIDRSKWLPSWIDDCFEEFGINDSGGIVSALNYITFPITSEGLIEADKFIDSATRKYKADAIVTAFLMPTYFADRMTVPIDTSVSPQYKYGRQLGGTTQTTGEYLYYTEQFDVNRVGGYTPKNKKLLTYPYKFLHATDFHGQSAEYRYEFFGGQADEFGFKFTMGMTPEPSMLCTPTNYKGNGINYNEIFIVKCYPQVGFAIDGFKAWLAQNWGTLITTGAVALGGEIKNNYFPTGGEESGGTKSLLSGGSNLALAFGTMMQVANHVMMPSYAKNNPSADAQWVEGLRGFGYCDMHITYNYAKRIDDFFDMFGYATNEVKVPNINSRPHWNYVKTTDANIFGNIPADSLKKIKEVFNRGITFWKYGDEIGDYSLDNRPV